MHYEKYMKQTYYTKDGTAKDKKEFVKVSSATRINPSTGYPLVSDLYRLVSCPISTQCSPLSTRPKGTDLYLTCESWSQVFQPISALCFTGECAHLHVPRGDS